MAGVAWPIDAVPAETGDPEYAARDARQASIAPLAGGATAARPLGAWSGVRPGTPADTVEVTSTTWTVHQVAGVIDVQAATESGPYGFAFDEDQTGSVGAADATYPRWDALYVVLDDPAEDDSTVPEVRVEYRDGTPAASPALPADPPDRSFRLCKIVVPAAGGGSPSVVWDAPYLPHATWPVRSDTERATLAAALAPTNEYPLEVLHIGTANPKKGRRELTFDGSTWAEVSRTRVEVDGAAITGAYSGQPLIHRIVRKNVTSDGSGDFVLLSAATFGSGGILDADFRSLGTLDLVCAVRMSGGNLVGRAYNTAGTVVASTTYPIVGHVLYWTA